MRRYAGSARVLRVLRGSRGFHVGPLPLASILHCVDPRHRLSFQNPIKKKERVQVLDVCRTVVGLALLDPSLNGVLYAQRFKGNMWSLR